MRAISLHQPWASLCVLPSPNDPSVPVKPYETRHWATGYRGTMLIHAAKKWNMDLYLMSQKDPFASALRLGGMMAPRPKLANRLSSLPFGCIVGAVYVEECWLCALFNGEPILAHLDNGMTVYRDFPTSDALAFGDFSIGRYAWALRNPLMFKTPIPYTGRQGFFNIPDEVVAEQMARAVTV